MEGNNTHPGRLLSILLLLHLLSKNFWPNHGPLRELLHHSDLSDHGQCWYQVRIGARDELYLAEHIKLSKALGAVIVAERIGVRRLQQILFSSLVVERCMASLRQRSLATTLGEKNRTGQSIRESQYILETALRRDQPQEGQGDVVESRRIRLETLRLDILAQWSGYNSRERET